MLIHDFKQSWAKIFNNQYFAFSVVTLFCLPPPTLGRPSTEDSDTVFDNFSSTVDHKMLKGMIANIDSLAPNLIQ